MAITFNANPVMLGDKSVKVGELAPKISLVANDLSSVEIGGKKDKIQVIVCVPSLDTAVCANEARRFNVEVSKIQNVNAYIVSMDLPFASSRFCTVEGIKNLQALSDFRNKEFSKNYGILIKSSPLEGLCARAIFIVDKEGKIAYKELVNEITHEPNYENAIKAIEKLS